MISVDREFHFIGELTINRSHLLGSDKQPIDDKVNWLFMEIGDRQFGFVYKINKDIEVYYNKPFSIELSFMLIDEVKKIVQLNQTYKVLRANEFIGMLKIIIESKNYITHL